MPDAMAEGGNIFLSQKCITCTVLRSIMTAVLLYRRNSNSASISWRHRVFLVRVLKIVSRTARQCVTEKRIRVSVLHEVSTVFLDSRFPIPPIMVSSIINISTSAHYV